MRLEFIFLVDQLRPIVEHALAAPSFTDTNWGKPIGRSLYLVKDHGVYLMSNGLPVLKNPNAGQKTKTGETIAENLVIYADGHNPEIDEFDSWWIGGDDFVDPLPAEDFKKLIDMPDVTHLKLVVTARRIEFRAIKRKRGEQ